MLVNKIPVWEAGDWLEGLFVLELFDRRAVQHVRLTLEKATWPESYSKRDATQQLVRHERVLREHKQLVTTGSWRSGLTLWGYLLDLLSKNEPDASTASARQMQAGLYVWPFRIRLPAGIQAASLVSE